MNQICENGFYYPTIVLVLIGHRPKEIQQNPRHIGRTEHADRRIMCKIGPFISCAASIWGRAAQTVPHLQLQVRFGSISGSVLSVFRKRTLAAMQKN